MAYCRWSSDHGECDVYVYENVVGGFTTHVAWRRLRHKVPDSIKAMYPGTHMDRTTEEWSAQYLAAARAEREWRATLPQSEFPGMPADSEFLDLATIGPEANQTFHDGTPQECAQRLQALQAKGFNVPAGVIDRLMAEPTDIVQKLAPKWE